MINYLRICLVTLALLSTYVKYLPAEEQPVIMPDAWQLKKLDGGTGYMNISGDYVLLGDGAPGTPSKFRQWPFFLDIMAGISIGKPHDDRNKVTHVHIEQNDCTGLVFTFLSINKVIAVKKITNSENVKFGCSIEALKITETSTEGCGEGGCRTQDIYSTYHLAKDGSLILHTKFTGVDRFLFFWSHFNEEYLVRFKKYKE